MSASSELGMGVFIIVLLAYLDSGFAFNRPLHILPLGPETNDRM